MNDAALFETDDTLTVAQVNRRLGETIKRTFSKEIWVQGQIRNLTRSGRSHVYFDLCDPVPSGSQPKASISVTLFDSNRQIVNRIIKRTGNSVRIDDGVEVRIRASVDLYVPRGQLQLNMTSIDPEFTLGRLGADRDQLLRDLKAEHLIDANAQLPLAMVPLRVGLVTSEGSAAHADFVEQLVASGYAFDITLLPTRVQGEFAPEEIAAMIARGNALDLDVVAVVRGGGARTDLAAFDTAPVARAIATSAKPVLCGIGHEIDNAVADVVAHASLKTPTACAQFLVERVAEFDSLLNEQARRLAIHAIAMPIVQDKLLVERTGLLAERVKQSLWAAETITTTAATAVHRCVDKAIVRSDQRLTSLQSQVSAQSSAAISTGRHRISRQSERLANRSRRRLENGSQELDLLEARLSAADPAQALKRGYSITTTIDGQLVRRADQLRVGDSVTTRLAQGAVTSTVDVVDPPSPSQDKT